LPQAQQGCSDPLTLVLVLTIGRLMLLLEELKLVLSRYVTRLHDAPGPPRLIHRCHCWYIGDVICGGVASLRYTKSEVEERLGRGTVRLCPKCFPSN
jgi:hypothetical protein